MLIYRLHVINELNKKMLIEIFVACVVLSTKSCINTTASTEMNFSFTIGISLA